jgi:pyrroloquinoline quinone (PQQ) biosynthesis protein C
MAKVLLRTQIRKMLKEEEERIMKKENGGEK